MNPTLQKSPGALALDIDSLLQGSYLLVVELRQGGSVQTSPDLWQHCVKQIEHVQQGLKDAEVSQRSIDLVSHAQCALLDETVLGCAKHAAHADWVKEPLQAKFFGRHQAGEFLYEDLREALREPAPDLLVLTAFQRVLVLGFQGRYRDLIHPERERLLAALNTQVAPLEFSHWLKTRGNARRRMTPRRWLQSTLAQILAAGLLFVGTWWGLNHLLGAVVATLMPGQP